MFLLSYIVIKHLASLQMGYGVGLYYVTGCYNYVIILSYMHMVYELPICFTGFPLESLNEI